MKARTEPISERFPVAAASRAGRYGQLAGTLARVAPAGALLCLGSWLLWAGLVRAPGLHDNDWPLLMWLVKHASVQDPSPLAVGHYGPAQLLLAWWLHPLVGSTLVAAKLLSAFGALLCVVCLYRMARRDHGQAAAWMAAIAFGLSAAALETGQSEFADPLACSALLSGLYWWWRGEERSGWVAGACMGVAGLMRTHFVIFSIGTALLAALLSVALPAGGRNRRDQAKAGGALVVGAVLGNLPGFLLNLWVHGQPGSAVAHTYVGQVLYGVDRLDFFNTYAAHPFGEILRNQPLDILRLMRRRTVAHVGLWLLPLGAAALAAWKWKRRAWPLAVVRHVLLVSGLSFAYFWLFVSLAWSSLPRLLFPITALNCWLVAVLGTQLLWSAFRHGRSLCVAAFVIALGVQLPSTVRKVEVRWRESNRWWQSSTELVHFLREHGMKDAREAFVYAWNRYVVDDPELQPFYNFGFWNLLVPDFRAERPVPTPYLNQLSQLASFLEQQNVKFFVLPRDLKQVQRFPALVGLVQDQRQLEGFRRAAVLSEDVVFVRQP